MNINGDAKAAHIFDAIVIGSGISGGWAAKELCEKGLRTLVLERGRNVTHITDYPTATLNPWNFQHRNRMSATFKETNPIATKCYALDESTQQFFVKDGDHPYVQEKPFDWIRGYQVGGKSLIWARQTQRWSRFDFEAPARDGASIDWPIRYQDVAPWYSYVEKFVGISGNKDGLDTLPDGEFLKPWELNCVEKHIQKRVAAHYKDRNVIIGRCAHLTEPKQIHYDQGRAQCQARHLCYRGCPYGGYFSSNSSTIPWAAKTGKLTLRPDSVVHSIIYDDKKGKATGVRVIDTQTKQMAEYFARIIFVNAACLNSNLILLNSTSSRFPNGLGNDNGLLGRYVAFHNYRGNIIADYEGFEDGYYYGRRPTTAFMPNFRNVRQQETDFQRGYMVAFSAARTGWQRGESGFGANFKDSLTQPGSWNVFMMMQGETVPRYENHVRLSPDQKDAWGIPQLVTSIDYTDNDLKMMNDFLVEGADMLEKSGCKNIRPYDDHRNPGLDIHEMGVSEWDATQKTSLLNAHNQLHLAKNVFVTDGAAMASTGNQNPSITFMALTARAANFAVRELKKRKFIARDYDRNQGISFTLCQTYVDQRINTAKQAMEAAQESANAEAKSSMGDKYETGRAIAQLERDRHAQQLAEALKLRQDLDRLVIDKQYVAILPGSLVRTNRGSFFISISAGKLVLDANDYFAISPVSPLALALAGRKASDSITFNKLTYQILEII